MNGRRLRLASTSPRRRLLLPLLGYPVEPAAVDVDEQPLPGERPADTARRLALTKADAIQPGPAQGAVIGSDTVVALEGRQLGKPADAEDARRMLAKLRGRPHEVVSGVGIVASSGRFEGSETTHVWMRHYSEDEIDRYVASGRPLDKAGAYAIQDVDFQPVERIEGCYANVVGLPLCEVSRGLRRLGWSEPVDPYVPPCQLCRLAQQALAATPR